MERVHIQLLTGLPTSVYARLRDAQRQAGAVWNVCCERHRQARISGERWPRRSELQQATKGDQFALHSQSVQMVVHAFLANVDTTRQLRAEGYRHMRYPYKTKRYYPVHWPRQAMAVYAHKIVLPMGRGRKSIVLARPGGLPDDGAACKLVWNGAGYELHWSIGEPDTPLKRAGTRATADLGQIHQVALTVETGQALVVSGRGIRSEKRRLSKTHGRLARLQSRCKKGSRRWWKLQSARNRQAARSRRRIRDLLERIKNGETVEQLDASFKGRGEEKVDLSLVVSPVINDSGRIVAASTIAHDITERRRSEAQREMLLHELSHRVKNALATVQAIAMQTLSSKSTFRAFQKAFMERLTALANAHDLLLSGNWQGTSLRDVIQAELTPYWGDGGKEAPRCRLNGPDVILPPKITLSLGMALHELATNAAKYGAFSVPSGRVDLDWEMRQGKRQLHLRWSESDGPVVEPPEQHSYGTRLIQDGLAYELDADVSMDFRPAGLQCIIDIELNAPLSSTRQAGSHHLRS